MRIRATSLAILAALFGAVTVAAHADTVTYSFTGGPAIFAGTNFTYVDTAGFLAFDTSELTPTTATDVFLAGTDKGFLTGFEFVSSGTFKLFYSSGNVTAFIFPYQIGAVTAGENLGPGLATLVITDTPSAPSVPEPSSVVLLGTGVLGLAGAARRRLLTA